MPQARARAFIGGKLLWRNSIWQQDEGADKHPDSKFHNNVINMVDKVININDKVNQSLSVHFMYLKPILTNALKNMKIEMERAMGVY